MRTLGERVFTLDDMHAFGMLSGDINPVHADRIYARRTMLGDVVLHGMHQVLWALDRLYDTVPDTPLPTALDVRFKRALYPGELVRLTSVANGVRTLRLQVSCDGSVCTDIVVTLCEHEPSRVWGKVDVPRGTRANDGIVSKDITVGQAAGRSGLVEVLASDALLQAMAPAAFERLGGGALAELTAVSCLVGMECPGLNSLCSAVKLELSPNGGEQNLRWQTARVDPKFSTVTMTLSGRCVRGEVTAFVRPRPVDQPSIRSLANAVKPSEFQGRRALIVGGSRGIGEVAAKLIAAGGGFPVLTYRTGRSDAERVLADILQLGHAAAIPFDVAEGEQHLNDAIARYGPFNELYYFATPRIFVQKSAIFDDELFKALTEVYVTRFVRIVRQLHAACGTQLSVLFPSTQALDVPTRELAEYTAAKAAGEQACRSLAQFTPGLRMVVPRFPRLATDQTATILPIPAGDPATFLLPEMRRMGRSTSQLQSTKTKQALAE